MGLRSIHQHKHRCILRRLHHVLKLLIRRAGRFELGVHVWLGFEEAQKETALDRVVDILRQRSLKMQRKDAKVPGRKEQMMFALRSWRLCAFALKLSRRFISCPPESVVAAAALPAQSISSIPGPPSLFLGANPRKPMSGKPTVATVPSRATVRLAAIKTNEARKNYAGY